MVFGLHCSEDVTHICNGLTLLRLFLLLLTGPNEFFSNNWVYEGLVAFGSGGVVPALAKSWEVSPNGIGGDNYTFQLREG